ncbi:MAG: soluble NSF attachment family protein [Treponema sp.]|jgi:tetratricopeptide (TPR) repeat protein|nr:soluble NSF attachment family protein [Treponema sp.]
MQNQNEKTRIGESINNFIQKNRRPIFVLMGTVFLLLITSIATLSLMDMYRSKAIGAVEDFSSRYDSLRYSINEESSSTDVEQLIAELKPFAEKNSGYAGGKAWLIIGSIHSERSEWAEAEAAWIKAAEKSAKNHIAPTAWFNAGVAAEQQEKTEQAIDHYTRSLSSPAGFSSAPRAQFSIGRLRETMDDRENAITAYRAVISGWPFDRVWTNLAHSRIIALEIQ